MRTGKQLTVIPSQEVAPMSPLMDIAATSTVSRNDHNQKSRKSKKNQSTRRESADSNSSEKLEELLQSSFSDDELDDNIEDSFSKSSRSASRTRTKSLGGSDITSRSNSRSNSSNDATSFTSSKRRQSEDTSKAMLVTGTTGRPVPTVLGGTTAESWATRVARLREDNDAEHKLFRHQGNQQVYEYDMRIRVIVRKRPVSNVEASLSGGVDVIHPLDYGDHGKILVYQPKTRVDLTKEVEIIPFAFDNVFDETSTNQQIYRRSLRNMIHPFFQGQWATVFAYGQTGSG